MNDASARPRRVLVLGGSGLMGAPTVRAFLAAGDDVTVLVRGTRPVPAGARARHADRTDADALAAALGGTAWDFVADLLAYTGDDVDRLLAVPGLAIARYVAISTGQVYLVGRDPRPPFLEEDAAQPAMAEPEPGTRDHDNWAYGVGKRAMERAVGRAVSERGLAATLLRIPVVHGAGDPSRRLWAYLQRLLDGGPLLLPNAGLDPVRFVWAEDVARALVRLADLPPPPAPAYNLAQPDEPMLADFVRAAAACVGREARIVPCTFAEAAAAGLDERFSPFSGRWCSRPDPARIARDLGIVATPSTRWLPEVVRAHLAEADPAPHPGYAMRERERALAARG